MRVVAALAVAAITTAFLTFVAGILMISHCPLF